MLFIALYLARKEKSDSLDKVKDSEEYFLGGRNLGWLAIGASLFASNIGSEHLVGLAGQGASGNFVASQFEILAALMLILLGWLFVPFYLKSGVFTMPEFLEKRYNKTARNYLSWVSIVSYVLTKISVTIAAGGIVFTSLLGIDFWTGAILIVIITGAYTVIGGLKAVVYTDLMQMFILIGGALTLTVYGLIEVDGVSGIQAATTDNFLSLWRPISDEDFPWTGILFGAPILGVWYWCTDQFIVQRVLAAKNLDQARKGTLLAGYLKLLPMFIFVLPGVIAFVMASGENPLISFPVDENGKQIYDSALPLMIMALLPAGLKGLVIAGLLAALMSSLSSVFNSCSTLFTFDIYMNFYPDCTDKKLVKVGQITTVVLVIAGLAWIPMLELIEGGLFRKLQSIQAYIAPPIAAVFLFGLLNTRLNSKGAMTAMFAGAAIGILRLSLELNKGALSGFWFEFADINFLHFALLLFLICSSLLMVVSYVTPKESFDSSLTLINVDTRLSKGNLSLTLGLLALVGIIWIWFA